MKITLDDIKQMVNECIYAILNENVYMDKDKINTKKKEIGLTYRKNSNNVNALRNGGTADYLKTDKMDDSSNSDTYIVKLKNGIDSYNITRIMGMEVMHFFKKFWDNDKAILKVKNQDSSTVDDYELTMLEKERQQFLDQFTSKVEVVLTDFINKNIKNEEDIVGISLYPVKSSSKFNIKMVNEMSDMSVLGLPVQIIGDSLLVKDLRNLEKDTDFIKRNQEFYDNDYTAMEKFDMGTVTQNLDSAINKYNSLNDVWKLLPKLNEYVKTLKRLYYDYNTKGLSEKMLNKLAEIYKSYYDTLQKCYGVKYIDAVSGAERKIRKDKIIVAQKYTKGPSVEKRSADIWDLVKNNLKGQKSPVTNKPYKMVDVCVWDKKSFEIKYLSNSIRLGLKNIYNPNTDDEYVKNELERINNTLFVIFDDNVSGGATLGDICYQCKKLGIKNLVPITFGQMEESNTIGLIRLNTPENGYNY